MKQIASLILIAGFSISSLSAQDKMTKTADKLFKSKGEYESAIQEYKKLLGKDGVKASYVNAQIAESYRLSNRVAQAAPFYKAAIDAGIKVDSIKFQYPFALKATGDYKAASDAFSAYLAAGGRPKNMERAGKEIENLKSAEKIASTRTRIEVSNLEALNTSAAEFSPFVQEKELIFSSSRGSTIYKPTGTPFTSLYKYKLDGSGPESVSELASNINTVNMHEASATISKDGKTLVFARSNDGSRKGPREVGLFISKYLDGKWSDPQPMPFSDPENWFGSPAFAPDGKTLYFSSNKRGGKGGLDLYRSSLDANGQWGKVTNLGEAINTAGDEVFPYVAEDGKLFFSSDGHAGIGGLDIFEADKDKDGNVAVRNMGVPMNSRWDDFGLAFKTPADGYFSSNREGGKGDDDIYYFRDAKNDPRIVKFNLEGVVFSKDDKGKEEILASTHVVLLDAQNKQLAETQTDENGMFVFNLEPSKNYTLLSDKKDFFTKRDPISTVGKSPDPETLFEKETVINMTHKMVLEKIKLEKTFVIDNIYYDLNKADIRPDAAIELDKIVETLNDNPTITIELSSHTDSRGDDKLNAKLSQARAESARAYIVSKGIVADRITAKGYGKTKPIIIDAATEEDFQKNRRTEFKVTKIKK